MIGIADNSHHRLHEGLTCAQIPILKARHQVHIEVSLLVEHVDDLVAGSSHSINIHALERLKNLIRTLLVLVHRADCPHIVVAVGNGLFGWEGNK